jgi:glycosyltransferase involved in cell wall biosynthesis
MVASIRDATFISDLRASDKPVRLSVAKYFSQRFAINGRSPLQFVYGLYGYARTAYTWNALKRADHITYASEALHDLFHELKVPGEAVYSVANPDNFTPPAFAIPNRDKKMPLFVYAGRLNKGKGAIFLYDAAVSLLKAGEQFQIAFIGKGELAPTLEETKWSKNLLGLGRLSREETLSVMQQATATVVPSLVFEGFPRAGIESISVGTPVIGTEVGGIPEAVGTAGIIIQPHDTKALTKTLQQLIHEPAVLKKLQAAAQREKGLYTPAAMCKRVEKIYMQLIKSRTS